MCNLFNSKKIQSDIDKDKNLIRGVVILLIGAVFGLSFFLMGFTVARANEYTTNFQQVNNSDDGEFIHSTAVIPYTVDNPSFDAYMLGQGLISQYTGALVQISLPLCKGNSVSVDSTFRIFWYGWDDVNNSPLFPYQYRTQEFFVSALPTCVASGENQALFIAELVGDTLPYVIKDKKYAVAVEIYNSDINNSGDNLGWTFWDKDTIGNAFYIQSSSAIIQQPINGSVVNLEYNTTNFDVSYNYPVLYSPIQYLIYKKYQTASNGWISSVDMRFAQNSSNLCENGDTFAISLRRYISDTDFSIEIARSADIDCHSLPIGFSPFLTPINYPLIPTGTNDPFFTNDAYFWLGLDTTGLEVNELAVSYNRNVLADAYLNCTDITCNNKTFSNDNNFSFDISINMSNEYTESFYALNTLKTLGYRIAIQIDNLLIPDELPDYLSCWNFTPTQEGDYYVGVINSLFARMGKVPIFGDAMEIICLWDSEVTQRLNLTQSFPVYNWDMRLFGGEGTFTIDTAQPFDLLNTGINNIEGITVFQDMAYYLIWICCLGLWLYLAIKYLFI